MRERRLDEIARDLGNAWSSAVAIPAPSTIEPSLTLDDAYAVQERVIDERLGQGRQRKGWKMGLTSAGPGTTPIVGTLLDDMIVPSGSDLSLTTMVDPMVEAEFVVRIGETLDGPVSVHELASGPHEVGPGIEVIDYRTTDATGVIDWVADNSTVAYAVVGPMVPVGDVSPSEVEASLFGRGEHLATGKGDQVMGNPLAAVAWLSQHLTRRNQRLEQGQVILTGSLTGHHPVVSGDTLEFTADFGTLGEVLVRFHP